MGSLTSNVEVLRSLRESARILFGLNHLAFLLCERKTARSWANALPDKRLFWPGQNPCRGAPQPRGRDQCPDLLVL